MKKLFLMLSMLLTSLFVNANHWQPNPYQFENNMISIGVVVIDGIEQTVDSLEIGAFHNGDCRGSALTSYNDSFNRYFVFMMLYGNDGDSLDFKIYDHRINEELNLNSLSVTVFESNGQTGSANEPFVFAFENILPPIQEYEVSIAISPVEAGVASGAGVYEEGTTCTVTVMPNEHWFFENWTAGGDVVSTDVDYTFTVMDNVELTANLYYYNNVTETESVGFELYPNPVSDLLVIKKLSKEKSELLILDTNGRMILVKSLSDDVEVIDMKHFTNGVYTVVVSGKTVKVVKK